jgi:pseudomonalisin
MYRDEKLCLSIGACAHSKRFRLSIYLLAVVLAASFGMGHAQGQGRPSAGLSAPAVTPLANHIPQWATAGNDAGAVPESQMIEDLAIVVARSPQQQQAFDEFTREQQDPSSPEYHHWLTSSEIGERFGRSTAELQSLTNWLRSSGLEVKSVSPGRSIIRFGGAAGTVGKAFQTQFHFFNVHGVQRMSVISAPNVPATLAPMILSVRGLYTVDEAPQHHVSAVQSPSPGDTVTSSSGDFYYVAPADFDTIYDVPTTLTGGTGITVGIVGESRTDFADFANFRNLTGTAFANPTEIVPTALGGVDPGPAYTSPPAAGVSTSLQGEAELDVFRVGSVAPAANIELVVATVASGGIGIDAEYLIDSNPAPQVMSISFGGCEYLNGASGVNYWNTLFEQGAAEGMSIFVASGDAGASGCDSYFSTPPTTPDPNSPNYICSPSYATCVGGTEFNDTADPSQYWSTGNASGLSSALSYIPEGAWNEPLNGQGDPQTAGTGGGVSSVIATPTWQTGTGVPAARAGRYTPDVAFSASGHDSYFACFAAGGGSCVPGSNGEYYFEGFEGTSAAAPGMAGIAALLDQNAGKAQGNLNPVLYQIAATVPAAFHDVTVASSGVSGCVVTTPSMCNNSVAGPSGLTGGQAGYLVTDGYDEATGLGSLDVGAFIDAAMGASSAISGLTLNPSSVGSAGSTTLTVTLSAAAPTGGATVALSSSNTAALSVPTSVTIAAGQTSQTAALQAGTVTSSTSVTITATYDGSSQQTQLTVTPQATPTVKLAPSATTISSGQSLSIVVTVSGSSGGPTPTGSVTVTSGSYTSAAATLTGGSATVSIAAGALSVGNDTLTATYTPDSTSSPVYNTSAATTSVTVTAVSYSMAATGVTMNPGGSATSTVTVSSTSGYAGMVSFSCAITQSPTGATDLPSCTVTQSVTLSSSVTSGTATVTVTSTAASGHASPHVASGRRWTGLGGGAALAILLFAVPKRSRFYRTLCSFVLLGLLASSLVACGGGGSNSGGGSGTNPSNPGTTAGNYTITVSGTGNDTAKTTATTTFTLTVN